MKGRTDSIIIDGNDYECWFCGRQGYYDYEAKRVIGLEVHHCCHGTAKRALADKHGLWVYLCSDCHRGTNGVHGKRGHERDLTLEKVAQRAWEAQKGSREEFRAIFGKSYLDDDNVAEISSERGCDGC